MVQRLDLIRAYIAASSPRYPDYVDVRALKPLLVNIPSTTDYYHTSSTAISIDRQAVYELCKYAIRLIHGLEDVLLLISSAAQQTKVVDGTFYHLLTRAITQLLQDNDTGGLDSSFIQRRQCFRLAALILIDVSMRESFESPPQTGRFVRALSTQLLDTKSSWGRSAEMFVKTMLRSDRVALETPSRAWYAADVIIRSVQLGESEWTSVEQKLRDYSHKSPLCKMESSPSSAIWDIGKVAATLLI